MLYRIKIQTYNTIWSVLTILLCFGSITTALGQASKQIYIHGTAHGKAKRVTFINYRSNERYIGDINEKNNQFDVTFTLDHPGQVMLMFGKLFTPLFVEPGSDVVVSIKSDSSYFDVKFKGDFAREDAFLWERQKKAIANFKRQRPNYKMPVDSFLVLMQHKYDKSKEKSLDYRNTVQEMNPAFIKYTSEASAYSDVSTVISLIFRYASQNKKNKQRVKGILADRLKPYLENMKIENPRLLHNESYTRFLQIYLSYLSFKKRGGQRSRGDSNQGLLDQLAALKSDNFENNAIKGYLAYFLAHKQLRFHRKENGTKILNYYNELCDNPVYRQRITQLLKKNNSTSKGQMVKNYTFVDIHGNKVRLKDFRGNYVYIDMWATWCAPCRKQRKLLKPIIEKYKNYNITFLSVSVDYKKDWNKWEKFVEKDNSPGLDILAKKSWQSPIMKDFTVNGIPHFMLIGPDGRIVNPDAARPSGSLKEVLANLSKLKIKD